MNSSSISRAINHLHPDARERLLQLAQTQLAIKNLMGVQPTAHQLYALARLEGKAVSSVDHYQRRNGRCLIVSPGIH